MRDYESIIILTPTIDEAESEKVLQRMKDVITSHGGEIVDVEKWGKRRLAYTVRKQKKGEYILIKFKGVSATVSELERNYKMVDAIIKYMTVRLEKEALKHSLPEVAEETAEGVATDAGETAAPEQETDETESGE